MNFISLNGCQEPIHAFARYGEGDIGIFHVDNSQCKAAEFDVEQLLEDDLPTMYSCPWCDTKTTETEHMRACSGYSKQATREEIIDAYSDNPSKRDSLLSMRGEL